MGMGDLLLPVICTASVDAASHGLKRKIVIIIELT